MTDQHPKTLDEFVQMAFLFQVEIEYSLKVMELELHRGAIEKILQEASGWEAAKAAVFQLIGEEPPPDEPLDVPRPGTGRKHWVDPDVITT